MATDPDIEYALVLFASAAISIAGTIWGGRVVFTAMTQPEDRFQRFVMGTLIMIGLPVVGAFVFHIAPVVFALYNFMTFDIALILGWRASKVTRTSPGRLISRRRVLGVDLVHKHRDESAGLSLMRQPFVEPSSEASAKDFTAWGRELAQPTSNDPHPTED